MEGELDGEDGMNRSLAGWNVAGKVRIAMIEMRSILPNGRVERAVSCEGRLRSYPGQALMHESGINQGHVQKVHLYPSL